MIIRQFIGPYKGYSLPWQEAYMSYRDNAIKIQRISVFKFQPRETYKYIVEYMALTEYRYGMVT